MSVTVSIVVFLAIVFIVLAITFAFSGGSLMMTERLGRLWHVPGSEGGRFDASRRRMTEKVLSSIDSLLPAKTEQRSETQLRLLQAGFRRPEAAAALSVAKVVLGAALVGFVYFSGFYKSNPVLLLLIAVVGGYLLPDIWLTRRVQARQQNLRLALPDALDLLVICIEAGLGLDQAMLYISRELRIAHPQLCAEFDLVNAEMHVGKTRLDALRSLATRTGVDDIQALVATLIQTDRFGTSIANSLRIHSDSLRTKRRQRAEEMAAKTTVKLVFPLVFFIFPALFVVIMGPAVITMMHTLGNLSH
jgi:tight adherence protein C